MNEKNLPPSETRYDDLVGVVSANVHEQADFNSTASQLAGYDASHYEAVALRVFIQESPIVTIYAIDRGEQHPQGSTKKFPVHKFKVEVTFEQLFSVFKKVNFTLTNGKYHIEDMEVTD
jgi:hypothetical protein